MVAARRACRTRSSFVGTADKIRLVDLLSDCGFQKIEVTSFVSPKWVPQLADAAEVMAGIHRRPGVALRGADAEPRRASRRHAAAGADEVAIFASASESFSQRQYQLLDRREPRSASGPSTAMAHEAGDAGCAAMSAALSTAL